MPRNIIQWNCRGFYSNFEDLLKLIKDHQPSCIALQETMQSIKPAKAPKGYHIYTTTNHRNTPGQGLALLVRNDVPSFEIPVSSPLNCHAISINIPTKITICNIYISPSTPVTVSDMKRLIEQLPNPFLILGDFNARHQMWGDRTENPNGTRMAEFVTEEDLIILNSSAWYTV